MVFESLEPRLVYSADLAPGLVEDTGPEEQLIEPAPIEQNYDEMAADQATDGAMVEIRHEVVFVDTRTPDYQQLIDDLTSSNDPTRQFEVVTLDPDEDGIRQISDALALYNEVDAVHLVSHGSEDGVQLGSTWLGLDNLSEYSDAIGEWTDALTDEADLLIYGCNLAGSEDGQDLIDSVAQLTGADVAASEDATGSAILGGDWELEYQVGDVESLIAFSAELQEDWAGILGSETHFLVGDGVPVATMSTATPTDSTLDNFDPGRDSEAGPLIAKGGSGFGESDPTKHQTWLISGGADLEGQASVTLSLSMKDFDTGKRGVVDVFLVDFDNAGENGILIAQGQIDRSSWPAGDFAQETVDFGSVTYEVSSGRSLGIKVVVNDGQSQDDMWFAYDATGYQSKLDITTSEENQVNTTTADAQKVPAVAVAPDGSYVVTWQGEDADKEGIFARVYDENGSPVTGEFQVNTVTSGKQKAPEVAIDNDGNFVIVWQGEDADDEGIFARVFDSAGTPQTGEILVNTVTADEQKAPDVTMDADGDFIVAWQGQDADKEGIYARVFDANGVAQTGEIAVNTTTADAQKEVSIAADDAGNFVVAWQGEDADKEGIFARMFDNAGVATTGEIAVNNITSGKQKHPDVGMDSSGDFVVAWEGEDAEDEGIFARRFDSSGAAQGTEFQVNTETDDSQKRPTVAMDDSGDFVIAWESEEQDGDKAGVFGQEYTSAGAKVGVEFQINTTTDDDQKEAAIGMDASGNFVVAWQGQDTDKEGIFTRTYSDSDTTPPVVLNNTGSTIAEGGTDTIAAAELAFTDTEQPASAVSFTVTTSPANGQLELTTDPGVGITSFTQDDIDSNRLVYVHDDSNTTSDSFNFDVDDGQGNSVTGQSFALTITAIDDDAPTQVTNTGSTVAEGGTDTIAAAELAFTDTEQPASAVSFTVTTSPTNGQLELTTDPGVGITSFTQDDIDNNRLVYVHDDSNTTSDSFNFDVDDGQGNSVTGQSFALTITAVDDDAPTQVTNTGSTIAEGGIDTIAAAELAFTDTEQPASAVSFTVTTSPANGQLELTTDPGVSITSLTQDDIDNNRLVYVHDDSNTTSDSFNFDVDDGQGNSVTGQSFALTITAVDDDAPTEVTNTGSTIAEGGTDTIAAAELAFTDTEQPASAVSFTVTTSPANGQLELTTDPGVGISSFTQDDIDNNRLVYVHDDSNTTSDSFNFDVDDGQGNSVTGQSFALTITAVDDDAPTQVTNTGSTIAEGGTDTIAAAELAFTDTEQPASAVSFTVTTSPTNGQLELTTDPGVGITSFTQDDIDNNRLVYVHDDSNTTSDGFNFDVDDGQSNSVTGQSFALTITAFDDDPPVVVNNAGSTVAEGGTDTLIGAELLFTDTEQPATFVAYTVTTSPTNGQLELTTAPGVGITSFTQDDIDNNRLVYVHDDSNTTSDSFNFDVDDGQGNSVTGQSFALTITAVDDDAPTQVTNTGSTVAEGGTDTIAAAELAFTDTEQPASAVSFTVTTSPTNGQLELTTDPGVGITSFTQDDIDNNRLVYVHDDSNTTSDSFNFDVDDGQGNSVTGQSFALTVTAVDDDAPTQVTNTGSTIAEGGTDTIAAAELAFTDTEQPASAVSFTVTTSPANGQLELTTDPGVSITSFTQDDIDNNRLVYVHDDSNTTSDSFDFDVDDGQGNSATGQSFALTITAVDDDAPTQITNTGSTIAEGGTDTIAAAELAFTDTEQPASAVSFTVTTSPANGQLELTTDPGVSITSFTQDDIDNNRLVYVHDDSNTTSDSFNFDVDDGQGNSVTGQSFALTITAVDDDPPVVVNNAGSTVAEGGTDTLIGAELLFTDTEQPETSVSYTVTTSPTNGQLELTTDPGVGISSFTQDDIDNNRLVYVHDDSNTTSDSFDFDVDDGQGNSVTGQSFALTITAVDDDAPTQVTNTGSTIAEGGTDTIAAAELAFTDTEQPASAVSFTVTTSPANGQLELTTDPGVSITSFTQDDIDNNRLVYVHDDSNTTSDSFNFDVDDGQGNSVTGQSFALTITAVDDDPPVVVNNAGSTAAEGGTDTLIGAELLFTDTEQPATSVAYTVTTSPTNGQLELTTDPGVGITSFTQDDIDNNRLVYVHDDSNTTSDSFNFDVDDGQGNSVTGQSFALTITAVDDDAPTQVTNTGSTIAEGGADTIAAAELAFTDTEQPASAVSFTVTTSPTNGQLELTTDPGVGITSFTQDDIDNNRFVYVHDDSNTTSDSFNFDVDDGQGNSVTGQSFALTITAVDDDAPTEVTNTGSTIAEGGTDTIAAAELAFTDTEQPASAVSFTVTTSPANGQLELTTDPGVGITSFTQDDIDNNRLVYVHDDSNTTSDSFNFDVDDGQGNSVTGQSFALTITAVDDDAPTQVTNTGSTIAEGGIDTIAAAELAFTDTEQPASAVSFTVTTSPANGQLELTTDPGVSITSFTQDDIDNNRLVYVHDDSNTTSDSFNFDVDDGQGNSVTGQSFALTITAVDDDAPTQVTNTGSTIAEGGTDTIAAAELAFTDTEQPATSVNYAVITSPTNGQLGLTTDPGVSITSFTQDDIDNNRLVYVHDDSNTTSDSFNFDVDDGQGNSVTGQSFALTITAVDDDAPTQVTNTGSTIAEGGTDTIAAAELAFTDTEQPASAVSFTVTTSPANGQLELTTDPGVSITSFTQDDIDNNRLVYVHDDSNTTSDSFNFDVDDGQGNSVTGQSFALTITAVDDDAPTQVTNTGSTIAEGGTDTIAAAELAFTDTEQPASAVSFTVTTSPANGQLELTTDPGVGITSFTQDDIDNNRLVYVHDDSNTTSDSFDFDVDDGQGNSVTGQSFALTITAVDDDPPVVVNNAGSTVAEGGTDTLIGAELLFTDTEQPATFVAYTVTTLPTNGQLELTTAPGGWDHLIHPG